LRTYWLIGDPTPVLTAMAALDRRAESGYVNHDMGGVPLQDVADNVGSSLFWNQVQPSTLDVLKRRYQVVAAHSDSLHNRFLL
jgi:hypothetical protein